MIVHRRLSHAQLETPVSDPSDRIEPPMTTLIGIDADPPSFKWLLETTWDGEGIGDIQIFKDKNCSQAGNQVGKPDWVWWGGVPRGRIKSYKFADHGEIRPQTVKESEETPFKPKDGKRKEEPGQVGQGGAARP